jgi:hypothetical protein
MFLSSRLLVQPPHKAKRNTNNGVKFQQLQKDILKMLDEKED